MKSNTSRIVFFEIENMFAAWFWEQKNFKVGDISETIVLYFNLMKKV